MSDDLRLTTPRSHPIEVVPSVTVASPAELTGPAFGPDVPFWTPSWRHAAGHLGWRWVMFLPAVAVVAVVAAIPWEPPSLWWMLLGHLKLLAGGVALSAAATGAAMRAAIGQRDGPFCIHCGYDLTGLPEGHACPECGRPFSLRMIAEYRRDPAWFVQRYRNRGDAPPLASIDAGAVRSTRKSRDGT